MQESLVDANVSTRQQYVYEGPSEKINSKSTMRFALSSLVKLLGPHSALRPEHLGSQSLQGDAQIETTSNFLQLCTFLLKCDAILKVEMHRFAL